MARLSLSSSAAAALMFLASSCLLSGADAFLAPAAAPRFAAAKARIAVPSTTAGARGMRVGAPQPLRMVSNPDIDNEFKRKLSEQRRWTKSTKQIATLGPVSCNEEMIEKLFLAGADVFRLNFSHGKHEEKKALLDIIRALEVKYNHPIAILADLQGPKLRVGTFDSDKVRACVPACLPACVRGYVYASFVGVCVCVCVCVCVHAYGPVGFTIH